MRRKPSRLIGAIAATAVTLIPVLATAANFPRTETHARPLVSTRAIPCEDTTVTAVGYYFEGDPSSGIIVTLKSRLGMLPYFPGEHAGVTDRDTPLNSVMHNERRGDRVQVCLIAVPPADEYCNPKKDSRGRGYRVYDYRQHAAYSGSNANHGCGGA